jgi:very-short-patch-repair endonuclease
LQAERSEGLVARFHLAGIGCDREHWRRAKANGRWEGISPRVSKQRGSPASESQRVLAAVLDASPGAALHHPSALAWLGLWGFSLRHLEVARVRDMSGATPTLATLHQLRSLRPHDIVVVRGVVTETALRAIWCEAARYASPSRVDIGYERVGRLLDAAHRAGLVTWAGLHEMVDDLRQRGRSGTVLMRALADARPPGSSPTESNLERRLEELLDRAGVRSLRRQVPIGGHEPIGRGDHVDDELPLVVETNSLTFHTTPTDRAADEQRYQRLMDAGFTVGVMWEPDLWGNGRAVVSTLAVARRYASSRQTVVIHSPGCPWPAPHVGAPSGR